MKKALLLTPVLLASVTAIAEDDKKAHSLDAEFGAILTSGNTESTALKGKFVLENDFDNWRTDWLLEALFKEDEVDVEAESGETYQEKQTTAEKYFTSFQADYKLDADHRGLFVFASYEVDKFSGFEFQASTALGYTDRLFKTDKSSLTYSIGPGYSVSRTEDTVNDDGEFIESDTEESGIVRLSGQYKYQISENAKFSQTLSSDYALHSDKNSKTRSETALTSKINSTFALKVSFTATYNTHVPDDKERSDTQTAVTLVYSF